MKIYEFTTAMLTSHSLYLFCYRYAFSSKTSPPPSSCTSVFPGFIYVASPLPSRSSERVFIAFFFLLFFRTIRYALVIGYKEKLRAIFVMRLITRHVFLLSASRYTRFLKNYIPQRRASQRGGETRDVSLWTW